MNIEQAIVQTPDIRLEQRDDSALDDLRGLCRMLMQYERTMEPGDAADAVEEAVRLAAKYQFRESE